LTSDALLMLENLLNGLKLKSTYNLLIILINYLILSSMKIT